MKGLTTICLSLGLALLAFAVQFSVPGPPMPVGN